MDNINLELWKEIQDSFSKELGIPIISLFKSGEKIAVSGELPFYLEMINSKRPDLLVDNGCIYVKKELVFHGVRLGDVYCGPVGFEKEFDFKLLSAKLGVEEEELIDSAQEIKGLSEDFQKVTGIFASIIPKLTFSTQKKDTRIMELTALYKIIKKVNSTLELEEVLMYIMNFLVNTLQSTNCSVFVYSEDGEKKYVLDSEVNKMAEVEKLISRKAIDDKKPIVVNDISGQLGVERILGYNSLLTLPLILKDEVIGTINIYGGEVEKIKDLEFISVVADQMSIAIANANKFG